MTVILTDTFTRANVASGWGTATDGNVWTAQASNGTLSVTSNEGQQAGACAGRTLMTLGTPGATDGQVVFRVSVSSITDEEDIYALCRFQDTSNHYWIGLNWVSSVSIKLAIRKKVAGTNTTLASSGNLTIVTNTFYWIKALVQGPNLYARFWQDGSSEPTTWTISTTDTSLTTGTKWGLAPFTAAAADTLKVDSFSVDDMAPVFSGQSVMSASPVDVLAPASLAGQGVASVTLADVLARPALAGQGALTIGFASLLTQAGLPANAALALGATLLASTAPLEADATLTARAALLGSPLAQGNASLAEFGALTLGSAPLIGLALLSATGHIIQQQSAPPPPPPDGLALSASSVPSGVAAVLTAIGPGGASASLSGVGVPSGVGVGE